MNNAVNEKLKELKKRYECEGFIIIGIFGSFARGEETENSDIDILYQLSESFLSRYSGFGAISRIEEIRVEISGVMGKKIDFAPLKGLGKIGKKYILPEVCYI
ncbi:MAG: hypothetical protein A2Y33_04250 [Spirochaetes bacterium GWF1_51_8]|nr:MAG: hypothetical protein A2Y33_04250 [Spirochaetes bacterium GWF1_51_8]